MTHPSPARIVVRIPGKLFIAGEYAVVTPGQPAVLAAVDLGVTVTLDAAAPARVVTSTGYKTLTWTPASPGIDVSDEEHGLDYVVAALTVMEDLRRERSIPDGVFALDIDSGLDDGAGRKFGLGSSAAVTVGVVRAVGGHLGLALTPDEEYRLAMLATLSVSPDASGGDVAASTHGGWIFYRSPDREVLAAAGALEVERRLRLPAWEVGEIVPIEPPTDLDLVVGWTGAPASTRSLVSAVQAAVERGDVDHPAFLSDSRSAVLALRDAFAADDATAAQAALRQARRVLRDLAAASGVEIETADLREMCDIIEGMGAAAKASGAGGGDCGVALVHPTVERDALERAWRGLGVVPLALSVTVTEGDDRVG